MVGLIEFAIYGGRVDNPFDGRVMVSYLEQMFNSNIISEQNRGSRKVGPMNMPSTTTARVRLLLDNDVLCYWLFYEIEIINYYEIIEMVKLLEMFPYYKY